MGVEVHRLQKGTNLARRGSMALKVKTGLFCLFLTSSAFVFPNAFLVGRDNNSNKSDLKRRSWWLQILPKANSDSSESIRSASVECFMTKPLVVSSDYFTTAHKPNGFHSENPLRIEYSLQAINKMESEGKLDLQLIEG